VKTEDFSVLRCDIGVFRNIEIGVDLLLQTTPNITRPKNEPFSQEMQLKIPHLSRVLKVLFQLLIPR
jgi:hypothetical protein